MTISDEHFDRWLDLMFTRQDSAWTEDDGAFFRDLSASQTAACLVRVLRVPKSSLELLTEKEVNDGLWSMLSMGYDYMWPLVSADLSFEDRANVVRLIPRFFEDYLAPHCDEHLSHLDRVTSDIRPLNGVCYMWWDLFLIYGDNAEPEARELNSIVLECMERILAIDHVACQESALHGLGHWKMYESKDVERIVDAFLARSPNLQEDLNCYAMNARRGCVQ